MVSGRDISDRMAQNLRASGFAQDSFKVSEKDTSRLDFKNDFTFVFDVQNKSLDILITPPEGSDEAFKKFLYDLKEPNFYKKRNLKKLRESQNRSRKYLSEKRFEIEGNTYHFKATLSVPRNELMYLDNLSSGIFNNVIKPMILFHREYKKDR